MKKILLILSLIISMVCRGQNHDIRNVDWGYSLKQVKEAEKIKPISETGATKQKVDNSAEEQKKRDKELADVLDAKLKADNEKIVDARVQDQYIKFFLHVSTLLYFINLDNSKFSVLYNFINDKLVRVMYGYLDEHTNKNLYIDKYQRIKDILITKYGSPTSDDIIWSDNLYKDDPEHIGLACSAGHVKFISSWRNDVSTVRLICKGDNFKISMGIVYESVKLHWLIKDEEDEKNKRDF